MKKSFLLLFFIVTSITLFAQQEIAVGLHYVTVKTVMSQKLLTSKKIYFQNFTNTQLIQGKKLVGICGD